MKKKDVTETITREEEKKGSSSETSRNYPSNLKRKRLQ